MRHQGGMGLKSSRPKAGNRAANSIFTAAN